MFHELENLLKNEDIAVRKRMHAIQAMAPQMAACAGGMLTALQDEISRLQCSAGGIEGTAYLVKIQIIEAVIIQHLRLFHRCHPSNEVDFGNAYFNYIAQDMGLPERRDPFISIGESQISTAQFEECKKKVHEKLTPGGLANVMAGDFLGRIKGAVADANIDVSGPFEGETLAAVFNIIKDLQIATLDREFGHIPEENYLLPVPDTYQYRLTQCSTRLVRYFAEHLKASKLVDYASISLTKGNAEVGAIMQLGDLFWRDKEGDCEPIEAQALLNVPPQEIYQTLQDDNVRAEEHRAILQGIAQHVLDASEAGNIQNVPEEWLGEFVNLFKKPVSSDKHWIVPVVMLAAAFNRTNTMRALIDAGADINAQDRLGQTAAMFATGNGHAGVLKVLIEAGADIEARDQQGLTALLVAARTHQVETQNVLLAGGADALAKDRQGSNALHFWLGRY